MLKYVTRGFKPKFIPSKYESYLGQYMDKSQEKLHRRLRKNYETATLLDFDNIPELFVRSREEKDTLRNLWKNKSVAGVVKARDEFPEVNIVHKAREVFDIYRDMLTFDGQGQPYNLSIDDDSDYFRVIIEDVHFHAFYHNWPMFMAWNRFIPGRPNRMQMRVVIDNWENSEANRRGGRIELKEDMVYVDVFTEKYPRVIKADFTDMLPGENYSIRKLVKDMPEGVQLAPFYEKRMHEPLFRVQKTVRSQIYWRYLKHDFDITKFAEIDLATMHLQVKKIPKVEDEGSTVQGQFLTKQDEEKIKKLSVLLNRDYEELKAEILESRNKQKQNEMTKEKKVVKK